MAAANDEATLWDEGRASARECGKPVDEIPRIELADREEPYEQGLARTAPSLWSALRKAEQARLQRVWRSHAQPEEQPWALETDWTLRLIPITETVADGRLDPGEYSDGWEFAEVSERAKLRFYDLDRGEPGDETLLTHPERGFSERLLLKWAEGIKRVRVELQDGAEVWSATIELPEKIDPEFPRTAFCVLKNPREEGEDGNEAGDADAEPQGQTTQAA